MKTRALIETRNAPPANTPEMTDFSELQRGIDEMRAASEVFRNNHANELRGLTDRLAAMEARANRPAPAAETSEEAAENETRAFLEQCRYGEIRTDELRALDTSVPGGGYTVPETFVAELIRNISVHSPVRPLARVLTIGGSSVKFPTRTAAMSAAWVDEGDESDEIAPTFGQLEIPAYEARAYIDVSNALLEDSALDLAAVLAEDAGEAFGVLESAAFVKGTGTGQPEGFTVPAGIPRIEATAVGEDVVRADVLVDALYSLPAPYRARATWAMNSTTLAAIRKLSSVGGDYLWQQGLKDGQPDTLLGRPVIEMPDMDDVGENKLPIAVGDFSNYRIVDRVSLTFLRDPYTAAVTSQTRFHMRRRVGGKVAKTEAFRLIKCVAEA